MGCWDGGYAWRRMALAMKLCFDSEVDEFVK